MKKPIYNFADAVGFTTRRGLTKNEIADNLRDTALRLVNAAWDKENREELIYNVQCAATDVLDFLDCIREEVIE